MTTEKHTPELDDDRRSMGYCLTHGDYNGRLLRCPECQAMAGNPTPGALRAGHNISERFRKALPHLPQSNADTLAAIIDRETGAPEMLQALEDIARIADKRSVFKRTIKKRAEAAIRKAKGE